MTWVRRQVFDLTPINITQRSTVDVCGIITLRALNPRLKENEIEKVTETLAGTEAVEAFSPRIRLGAMFSNFIETTNIRLNAVYPEKELQTVPLLKSRIRDAVGDGLLKQGEIVVPDPARQRDEDFGRR